MECIGREDRHKKEKSFFFGEIKLSLLLLLLLLPLLLRRHSSPTIRLFI